MSLYFVGDLNILADKKLSSNDVRVYFALVSFMNKDTGKCYPRYATIKKRIGLSNRTIQRSVQNLAKHKYITIKRLSSSNLYLLTSQITLEGVIKKRVKGLFGSSDRKNWRVLEKPSYYNYNNRKRYNVNNSNNRASLGATGVEKHFIEYKGNKYKEFGREGPWIEYIDDKGNKIKKHSFQNTIEEVEDIRKKKFKAAARKAAYLCAS